MVEGARDEWSADWALARQCVALVRAAGGESANFGRVFGGHRASARLCLLARGEPDPLTLPLTRGKPRTRR